MAGKSGVKRPAADEFTSDKRRFAPRRLPFLLTVVVVGYLLFSLSGQFLKLAQMESQVRGMEQQVNSLQAKNQALENQLRLIQSDAYIEQVARQLGYVKPGEHPVLPVTKGVNNQQ
jgi:cell division protein DivIC